MILAYIVYRSILQVCKLPFNDAIKQLNYKQEQHKTRHFQICHVAESSLALLCTAQLFLSSGISLAWSETDMISACLRFLFHEELRTEERSCFKACLRVRTISIRSGNSEGIHP